jgi:alkyldihydroxyacetonephosphate synthase
MPERVRRWNGWGYVGESFAVSGRLVAWVEARLGRGEALPEVALADVRLPPARSLPLAPGSVETGDDVRLRHSRGMSFLDLVALRTGELGGVADGVVLPRDASEVVALLRTAAANDVGVIVRGGGTSVVGGVTVPQCSRPVVVLSLERMRGMRAIDVESRLATFGGGTYGPEVESALAGYGLRLGHEPQSFELSTIGGWVAARSAGQRSTGVGKIERLVAGLELATPGGVVPLPAQPASAAGPDLRHLVLGSEGRLGAITEVTVRVGGRPEVEAGVTALLPSWEVGLELARGLLQAGIAVEVLRLSDVDESAVALAALELPAAARRGLQWLQTHRRFRRGCLLLLGWSGTGFAVATAEADARRRWRELGAVSLGRRGYRSWLRDRFRHPYLRDALLSMGWGTDTLETAGPWSKLAAIRSRTAAALTAAAGHAGFPCIVLCHLSHAYPDGASLYFTFLWPLRRRSLLEDWNGLKASATDALLAAGGTLSHHHGVGTLHARWLERELGQAGTRMLRAMASAADPARTLNPGVLLGEGTC